MTDKVLKKLKEDYLGKEIELLDFDNDIVKKFGCKSIFEYDVKEMLRNSFAYLTGNEEGYNFEFEVISYDEENIDNIIVKLVDIYTI